MLITGDGPTGPSKKARKLRVLVASTSVPAHWLLEKVIRQLLDIDVELIAVSDASVIYEASLVVKSISRPNAPLEERDRPTLARVQGDAARLAKWAELLILAPMEASALARMLHGITTDLVSEVLRSWDVSKKILLVPGMSCAMWENPMTRKQLTKIRRKWKWITVFTPLLWSYKEDEEEADRSQAEGSAVRKLLAHWDGMDELIGAVKHQVDLATIGHNVDVDRPSYRTDFQPAGADGSHVLPQLPPELWSIILEYTNDWELAQSLGIRTNLPVPMQWRPHIYGNITNDGGFHQQLELALLRTDLATAHRLLATSKPLPKYLSRLSIQMIMRWALIPTLTYLETYHKDLFWTAFGHSFIPNKASAAFGRVELLEYWRTSPSFLTKEYTDEAMDQASGNGFVHVLEWWKKSGLSLKYTEAALEIASGRGHISVLEWWRSVSTYSPQRFNSLDTSSADLGESSRSSLVPSTSPMLHLKPGRSISNVTQSGHLPALRWWAHSTIPFPHEDTLLKLASAHGHVHILDFWLSHRGSSKLLFDSSILVAPTRLGHANVLEWWRDQARKGMRVEYKICDIEEALEDAGGSTGAEEVRRWWAKNGLNLGVGTSEWMKTKLL